MDYLKNVIIQIMRTDDARIALILTLALSSVLPLTLSGSLASPGLYCDRLGSPGILLGSPGVFRARPGPPWALPRSRGLSRALPGLSWAVLGSPGLTLGSPAGSPWLSWALPGARGARRRQIILLIVFGVVPKNRRKYIF